MNKLGKFKFTLETVDKVPSPKMIRSLLNFNATAFGSRIDEKHFIQKLSTKYRVLIQLCMESEKIVGMKIGYEEKPGYFYSWLGGVLPNFRRRGIASKLMLAQHDWCKKNGYSYVETRTRTNNPEMMILNLKARFKPEGFVIDPKHGPQIIFIKTLRK